MKKRVLCLLLVLAICMGMIVPVMAADTDTTPEEEPVWWLSLDGEPVDCWVEYAYVHEPDAPPFEIIVVPKGTVLNLTDGFCVDEFMVMGTNEDGVYEGATPSYDTSEEVRAADAVLLDSPELTRHDNGIIDSPVLGLELCPRSKDDTRRSIWLMFSVLGEDFPDVPAHSYYATAIRWAASWDIARGYEDGTFRPKGSMTRRDFVTLLYREAGEPQVASAGTGFADVPEGRYYSDAVAWAAANGYVKGRSESCFDPDTPITRAEVVTLLYRIACDGVEQPYELEEPLTFQDIRENAFYADALKWAYDMGYVKGKSAEVFGTNDDMIRGDMVLLLFRMALVEEDS